MIHPRTFGIRTRVLAVAVVALLLAVGAAGGLMLDLLDDALTTSARNSALLTLREVAAQVRQTGRPASALAGFAPSDDVIVQVLDQEGTVVATTGPQAALSAPPPFGRDLEESVAGIPGVDADAFLLVGRTFAAPGHPRVTVLVASSIHVEEGQRNRYALLIVVTAVGILFLGILLVRWALASSLASVDAMRSQLAAITRPSGRRVDVPATGDELERLAQTMNDTLSRLDAAFAMQRTFLADAGHELRSPVATLLARLEGTADDPVAWQRVRADLTAEVRRMQRLVDDLLTLSRTEVGALRLRSQDCDLDDLVLSQAVPGDLVSVTPVRVDADPDRIVQILRNLVDNARRYAATTVRIEVRTVAASGTAEVIVDNDGPVVAPEDRIRIFERFVRLHPERDRDTGGSGLGLAIAAALARAHDGTLVCEEAPDGWCRFRLRLPMP